LEAWCVEAKEIPSSHRLGGSLASHPDRREIVAIVAEDCDGSHKQGSLYILRPESGKPTLSPVKIFPSAEAVGRFVNLFSENGE
jgi:hypothetical protein